jgi:aminoglycoside 3-N-acetyltransferase I
MTDTLRIHRLTANDIDLLRQLNALFAEAFDDADGYAAPPDDNYCRKTLARDHLIALVALQEQAVVGGLVAYELPKLERPRSEIYLYDLAVARNHRRQGIATRLIERLRAIADARGAWVVFVQADYGDDPAIALYSKLGTREDVMHFDLPVP